MRQIRSLLAAAVVVAVPTVTRAQGYDPAFSGTYTSSGSFFCDGAGFPVGSTCSASGNSLTLGSGGSLLTLTYVPLAPQTILVNGTRRPITFGSITESFSGSGPFAFPVGKNPNLLTFGFVLTITGTNNRFGFTESGSHTFGYVVTDPTGTQHVNCCNYYSGYTFAGGGELEQFGDVPLSTNGAPALVTGTIGTVPEPATLALTLGGLAVLGAGARRRARA